MSAELRELVSSLNSHGLNYIVVGSHALAFYGVPRFTEDVDFFIERTRENISRLGAALQDFGVGVIERINALNQTYNPFRTNSNWTVRQLLNAVDVNINPTKIVPGWDYGKTLADLEEEKKK